MPRVSPIVAVLASLLVGGCADAAAPPPAIEPVALLQRVVDHLGGSAALADVPVLDLDLTGTRYMIDQSRRADPPWDPEPSLVRIIREGRTGRWLYQNETSYPGLGFFGNRLVVTSTDQFQLDPRGTGHGLEVMGASASDTSEVQAQLRRFVPGLLLERVLATSSEGLRQVAAVEGQDAGSVVLAYANPSGREVFLEIDTAAAELVGYFTTRPDAVYGTVKDSVRYGAYSRVSGLAVPGSRTEYFNGMLSRTLTYRVGTIPAADSLFAVPARYLRPNGGGMEMGMDMGMMHMGGASTLRSVGAGLYLDASSNALVVEFADHVAVFDCPNTSASSQATIDAIGETLPGKSVRYLVASHTHPDHCGGARPYFGIGARVITAADHADFYRRLAAAPHELEPDGYDAGDLAPVIETIALGDERVLEDGTQRVRLVNVGPSPHTDEMLVGLLDGGSLLWQVDLWLPQMTGPLVASRPVERWFGEELTRRGWPVERILDTHTGQFHRVQDFRAALKRAG